MKRLIRDFFALSVLERKGTLLLITALFAAITIRIWLTISGHPSAPLSGQAVTDSIRSFLNQSGPADSKSVNSEISPEMIFGDQAETFYFDPNTVSQEELKRLGLEDRVIKTLLNYRKAGGKFRTGQDFGKIYGLSNQQFERLLPWVKIAPGVENGPMDELTPEGKDPAVNINLADTAELATLPGIGPVLSRRIVKYRSLLGGYYDKQQLKEVYGLKEEIFSMIEIRTFADPALIHHINVNTAGEDELKKHPYIGSYIAGGIIEYRKNAGPLDNLEELVVNGILKAEELDRLKNYLTVH